MKRDKCRLGYPNPTTLPCRYLIPEMTSRCGTDAESMQGLSVQLWWSPETSSLSSHCLLGVANNKPPTAKAGNEAQRMRKREVVARGRMTTVLCIPNYRSVCSALCIWLKCSRSNCRHNLFFSLLLGVPAERCIKQQKRENFLNKFNYNIFLTFNSNCLNNRCWICISCFRGRRTTWAYILEAHMMSHCLTEGRWELEERKGIFQR